MEAIIEDEVTSRFEAEELKNWNLLTRTNRYYGFISWRLSIIWFIGFFIRYFILMPFRVIICFVGVSFICTNFTVFFCWCDYFFSGNDDDKNATRDIRHKLRNIQNYSILLNLKNLCFAHWTGNPKHDVSLQINCCNFSINII